MRDSIPAPREPRASDTRRLNGARPPQPPLDLAPTSEHRRRPRRFLASDRLIAVRFAADALMLALGTLLGCVASHSYTVAPVLVFFPPLTLTLLYCRGRYRPRLNDLVLDNMVPGFGAISIGAMSIFVVASLVYGGRSINGSVVMGTWLASLICVTGTSSVLATVQYQARKRRRIGSPTLIVGVDPAGTKIATRLTKHPEYGLRPLGFLDSRSGELGSDGLTVLGGLRDLGEIATSLEITHVILAFPAATDRELLSLIKRCDELDLATMVLPRLSGSINYRTQFEYLGTLPVLNLRAIEPDDWRFEIKHRIDRVIAGLLLLVLLPLLILIAITVKLSSPGPVLFRQLRASRGGAPFQLLKFRTMIDASGVEDAFAPGYGMAPGGVEGVDRRTRVGRLLRRTALDELPQLLNVLRGEMSLVGPRPERPQFVEQFRQDFEGYHDRLRVRPGITGWAQVNGFRGQTPVADRVEFDNFYIEHWSLALDAKILILTIPAVLKGG